MAQHAESQLGCREPNESADCQHGTGRGSGSHSSEEEETLGDQICKTVVVGSALESAVSPRFLELSVDIARLAVLGRWNADRYRSSSRLTHWRASLAVNVAAVKICLSPGDRHAIVLSRSSIISNPSSHLPPHLSTYQDRRQPARLDQSGSRPS